MNPIHKSAALPASIVRADFLSAKISALRVGESSEREMDSRFPRRFAAVSNRRRPIDVVFDVRQNSESCQPKPDAKFFYFPCKGALAVYCTIIAELSRRFPSETRAAYALRIFVDVRRIKRLSRYLPSSVRQLPENLIHRSASGSP